MAHNNSHFSISVGPLLLFLLTLKVPLSSVISQTKDFWLSKQHGVAFLSLSKAFLLKREFVACHDAARLYHKSVVTTCAEICRPDVLIQLNTLWMAGNPYRHNFKVPSVYKDLQSDTYIPETTCIIFLNSLMIIFSSVLFFQVVFWQHVHTLGLMYVGQTSIITLSMEQVCFLKALQSFSFEYSTQCRFIQYICTFEHLNLLQEKPAGRIRNGEDQMRTSEQTCGSMGLRVSMQTSWCPMLPNQFGEKTHSLMPLLQIVRSQKLKAFKGEACHYFMLKYNGLPES